MINPTLACEVCRIFLVNLGLRCEWWMHFPFLDASLAVVPMKNEPTWHGGSGKFSLTNEILVSNRNFLLTRATIEMADTL